MKQWGNKCEATVSMASNSVKLGGVAYNGDPK